MKLVEMNVNDYLDLLKSDAPAPGGGSVSALAGAQGVGLTMMVCDLTLGKEKYAEHQELCKEVRAQAEPVYKELVESVDRDTEAFNLIAVAFKMPKETEEDKAARRKAIAEGTLEATRVPFRTMELAYQGLQLADRILGKSNQNAASDLGVGIINLLTCIRGAWMNVRINLPGVKDETFAAECQKKGQDMIKEAEAIAEKAYKQVLESL